jgi:hypothetical protein
MKSNMRSAILSALVVTTALLSGCAPTGEINFKNMSSAYRDVLESYANDNILLNIVRSSQHMPMTFLDMPSVVGSGNVTSYAAITPTIWSQAPSSVTGFFSGGIGSTVAPTVSLQVNSGFNFTQSSLDNSAFMASFLSDIKPDAIDSLTNNDAGPKSVLYTLVIEFIEVRDNKNKVLAKYNNNPYDPEYPKFQQALYRLIDAGLSTEIVMNKQVLSAPMDADTMNKNMRALVASAALPGAVVMPADTSINGKPALQLVRIMPETRMCINKDVSNKLIDAKLTEEAFCSSENGGIAHRANKIKDHSKKKIGSNDESKKTLVIKLRSTRNVFDFLGMVVNLQNRPDPVILKIKNSDLFETDPSAIDAPMDEKNAAPLFIVEKNKSTSSPITSIQYRGQTYSIPSENNGATNMVIVLLSELLTLNKVPGSIPPSPSVLIK